MQTKSTFTFLGTGTSQGIPVIACPCAVCQSRDKKDNRLRTAGMLEALGTTIVFDSGPDFRQQMLREKVKVLDAVVFTHPHKDHTAGMDDIRAFNFLLNRKMDVFANDLTLESLKREFPYVFAEEKYPGVPEIELHKIHAYKKFETGNIALLPIHVMHHKMPVLGFRYQNFAYITDANFISDKSIALLQDLDVLVLNALRIEPHISHFNLAEAIEMVERLKPKKAYFTHLSHLMGKHKEVSKLLPKGIALAYDGLRIEL
jgi:phosphoribosyl 1,2-cyclic phosphate phosphodiesterase